MPSDEKGGVGNGVGSDTDMALFDEASCLKRESVCVCERERERVERLTAETVWAILSMHMTTGRRLRQKAATESLLSTSERAAWALRRPIS